MPRGFFITFDGPDGSGKTTQLRLLSASLTRSGYPVTSLRQPGGTPLGDRLRAVLLDSRSEAALGPIAPMAELALMFADRAQAIHQVIQPALAAGHIVLCDRFTDSSEAYQGGGRDLGSERVLALHQAVCGSLQPDLTLLLLPPLAVSLRRARRRNRQHFDEVGTDENRFEAQADAFYQRVHAAYQHIARRDPERVLSIDGDESVDVINRRILEIVASRLPPHVEPL